MIDTTIGGRYRVVRLLGQGGMGSVYEAADAASGARVAVKVVTAEAAGDPTLRERFQREARAAAALATRHIVRVLDAGSDAASGLPFLVMELLDGEDLHQILKRVGPVPADVALRIAAQAALGIQEAHARGVVHRDIKPANLFLARGAGAERTVKVLDFGVAKVRSDLASSKSETSSLTRTGSMIGSPRYMAPEQARGHKSIDHRADIWSLGVALYQALSGRTPHDDNDTVGDLIVAICTEPPEPIQSVASWVPPDVADVLHRALFLDPGQRYQTVGDMLGAMAAVLPGGAAALLEPQGAAVPAAFAIREEMLRGLSAEERSRVAPPAPPSRPAVIQPLLADATLPGSGAPGPAPGGSERAPESAARDEPAPGPGSAEGPATPAPGTVARPSRGAGRTVVFLAGAVLLAAAGGALAYVLARAPAASGPAPPATAIEAPKPPGASR